MSFSELGEIQIFSHGLVTLLTGWQNILSVVFTSDIAQEGKASEPLCPSEDG